MNTVFYGRYSTDMQREASLDDQFRNCERHAQREGWNIGKRYEDKAVSGSTKDRPGYQAMLADAREKRFDVLLVDDLSRLSRDNVETQGALKRLKFWGVRVIAVSDGFDSDAKAHKIQAGIKGMMNELYLDDLAEKTHRGLTGQALKGHNAGGKSYGYRHIPIEDPTRLDEFGRPAITAVRREVDPGQAKVVRQIFQWFAGGHSPRWIASELNRQGIPSPRGKMWAMSAIAGNPAKGAGLLNNPLYRGVYIWNRTQWVKDPDTGKRKVLQRPREDWVINEAPDLRIVSDELWDAVQARMADQRARSENIRKALHTNARTGAGPKYLFSGLLKCGVCGGNFVIVDALRYGCATARDRGPHACSNSLKVGRALVEDRLLAGIKEELFTPEAVDLFIKETTRLLREHNAKGQPDRAALEKDLQAIDAKIGRLVDALEDGLDVAEVKDRLAALRTEKARLTRLLGSGEAEKVATMLPRAVDTYKAMVNDLGNTTQREVAVARTQVKKLLGGEVKLIPLDDHLEAELVGDYLELAALTGCVKGGLLNVVAGAGFEPATFGL